MAMEGLPEELMTLILSKLPVKSLLRCKCVRKSWYSLIKSPQFIHLHLTTSHRYSKNFIVRRYIERGRRHVLSLHSYETLDDLGNDINIPISISRPSSMVSLSGGHCDGLVCITDFKDQQVLICNPAMREFRSLPVPSSFGRRRRTAPGFPIHSRPRNISGYRINSVAFGSDPNTGKYKVVMIASPYDIRQPCPRVHEFLVYDFSADSWREKAINPGAFRYLCLAISLNGAFHWGPWGHSNDILRFRISDEVTDTIPLPDDFVDVVDVFSRTKVQLFVSSKSQLSLILYDSEGRFEVCVMTEYGVKESWTRLFKIGPLLGIYRPLAWWDEQQLLVSSTNSSSSERQLVSCDLQHQNVRHFPIYGDFDLYLYSESLVSVNSII